MKPQYPSDYNPPQRGTCQICQYPTKGWTRRYLGLCPKHWQALEALVNARQQAT